jgi:hypothetical protein
MVKNLAPGQNCPPTRRHPKNYKFTVRDVKDYSVKDGRIGQRKIG